MTENKKTENKNRWLQSHAELAAVFITLLAFLARLWTASGTFLNPDEALHFRLANQFSLAAAYKESLTAAHPPLLILLLYYWRALGTSELWLRLPSVLAGATFCWMYYKWLTKAAGQLAGFIGLLFVALLPPLVVLFAEVRQYPLLLAFLVSALYFLDEAFAENSLKRMAIFSLCLYAAMLFHYSAFLFAAALGVYALIRIVTARPPLRLTAAWAIGQFVALALALFLYRTHLSKLGEDGFRGVSQGWMSESYLHRSFFESAHDNLLSFLVGHTFGVFQYFFGQLAVGDVMGLVFLVGVALLLRGRALPADRMSENPISADPAAKGRTSSRRLGIFLLLPFAIAGAVSLAHLYPYGGTRHVAFLIIPAMAGVSVAIACLTKNWARGLTIAACIIAACIFFGKPRQPRMDRADQSRAHMAAAMQFIKQNVAPSDLIFTDYQSDLIVGHYLCQQRPILIETLPANFEQFSCGGRRVVSTDYKTEWLLSSQNFPTEWQRLVKSYSLKSGDTVWVIQAGWGLDNSEDLRNHFPDSHDHSLVTFGRNIKIFKLTVGNATLADRSVSLSLRPSRTP